MSGRERGKNKNTEGRKKNYRLQPSSRTSTWGPLKKSTWPINLFGLEGFHPSHLSSSHLLTKMSCIMMEHVHKSRGVPKSSVLLFRWHYYFFSYSFSLNEEWQRRVFFFFIIIIFPQNCYTLMFRLSFFFFFPAAYDAVNIYIYLKPVFMKWLRWWMGLRDFVLELRGESSKLKY